MVSLGVLAVRFNSNEAWAEIARDIAAATGAPFQVEHVANVSGGSINSAWKLSGGARRYFVKVNDAARAKMFEAEAAGLAELAHAAVVKVPQPICHGANSEASWIVLEHLELKRRTAESDALLGEQLAALHRRTAATYGWDRDNTLGSTPQPNSRSHDWPAFWREHRLGFQFGLARANGYGGKLQTEGEKLLERIPDFFRSYRPLPSLLHGDLWSGNSARDASGAPVIFDPAVYYGDREADVAMTELFGGYSPTFYAAYDAAYPRDAGYGVRRTLYNLYHVLNHLNLFGGRYRGQAESSIASLLAELR